MIKKSVYIWSKDFSKYDNELLIRYLVEQDISKVFLAFNSRDDNLKLKVYRFLSLADNNRIRVDLMTGNNYLVFEDRKPKLEHFIREAAEMPASGAHLDVEPHAFKDWKVRQLKYMRNYLSMLGYAYQLAEQCNLELTASIPLIYGPFVTRQVYRNTHKVNLMAYEQRNARNLNLQIVNELKIDHRKSVIALRPKDFGDFESLKRFMFQLYHQTSISHFAIHDIGALIHLQQKPLKP